MGERKRAMSETPSVVPDGTRFPPARNPSDEYVFSVVVAQATERRSADFSPQGRW